MAVKIGSLDGSSSRLLFFACGICGPQASGGLGRVEGLRRPQDASGGPWRRPWGRPGGWGDAVAPRGGSGAGVPVGPA